MLFVHVVYPHFPTFSSSITLSVFHHPPRPPTISSSSTLLVLHHPPRPQVHPSPSNNLILVDAPSYPHSSSSSGKLLTSRQSQLPLQSLQSLSPDTVLVFRYAPHILVRFPFRHAPRFPKPSIFSKTRIFFLYLYCSPKSSSIRHHPRIPFLFRNADGGF